MTYRYFYILASCFVTLFNTVLKAQEVVVPLQSNAVLLNQSKTEDSHSKKYRIGLPFVDDFSYEGPYPTSSLWADQQVYVNNTMSADQITRGVATFDGLNQYGRPYLPNQFSSGLADSLTSQSIDLSSYTAASNVYLSFYYQPQGLSFAPEQGDSLFLYFKNSGNQWVRKWQQWGTPWQPFKVILIPVTDAQFLHNDFQFRFVNIASLNLNNDIWNLDYVKLDANRSPSDSISNDVAFTLQPTSILSPYSSMPYRHFVANQANEKSTSQEIQCRNLYALPQALNTFHQATELFSSTPISTSSLPTIAIAAKSSLNQSIPSYPISYTAPNNHSKVVVRNKYYISPVSPTDRKINDTIINDCVFDNYFAYDDGSAEKAYFLLPAFNFPAKTALEFKLNEPDTLRGMMAYFGAQAPTALGKYFSLVLYKQLAGNGLQDSIIRQEDLYQVKYDTAINGFVTYAFSTPVVLQSGTYYMGITQPANFGSDSIYYGLDVNNNTSTQHLYYNVDGNWYASTVSGSVMIRPIVGQFFTPTQVGTLVEKKSTISLYPNPAMNDITISTDEKIQRCTIYQLNGSKIRTCVPVEHHMPISDLKPGNYLLEIITESGRKISSQFSKK